MVSEGTGYQNVQKRTIPKNVVKKLRSGDKEKMKKNHLVLKQIII